MDQQLQRYINTISHRMFVDTADQNYILARWAFVNSLNVDFFWLLLHAVEKYLKAILLKNGLSAKPYSHDIVKLLGAVRAIDARISFAPLSKPDWVEAELWHNETFYQWIVRLAKRGDPNNRYMTYGYSVRTEDLFKADQVIWCLRRYCQAFSWVHNSGEKTIKIDYLNLLIKDPTKWMLDSSSLLERLFQQDKSDDAKKAFSYLNGSFFPNINHQLEEWGAASSKSPFADLLHLAHSTEAKRTTKNIVAEVLSLSLVNIPLSKEDKEEIGAAIEACKI